MQKHFFFDLDNTLTPSKSHIESAHVPLLQKLCERAHVVVVSGHGEKDIRKHLAPVSDFFVLGQNGNRAVLKDGTVLWNRALSVDKKAAALAFITEAREELKRTGVVTEVQNENDIVEDRGSQIAFSLIGHHENQVKKDAFDPDQAKRRKLLSDLVQEVETLKAANMEIRIAGTTNLDLIELGKNKGYNVPAFIEAMDWKKEDCIYIGDALFPGGNDETVIGILPVKAVKNYKETYLYLEHLLRS